MSSKDSHLYNQRPHKLSGGKEISSSTTLSFTSQLSSLINTSANSSKPASSRSKPKKDDIFSTHNRNSAKRAKRDLDAANNTAVNFSEQKHSTNGDALDKGMWERSKRKMEEKARLYAAMKRGDVEDMDEKYTVDFDRKWAEKHEKEDCASSDDSDDDDGEEDNETVEYTDEFGRTRTGSRAEAARAKRQQDAQTSLSSDRFTARPSAPSNIIHGDTIQHAAFNPDAPIAEQMAELAAKRDKSLTPPPEEHFDGRKEVRNKGTGFFQFSNDTTERAQQMEGLEAERAETERVRKEREDKLDERKRQIEARRRELQQKRGKRKADEFLDQLGSELAESGRVVGEKEVG